MIGRSSGFTLDRPSSYASCAARIALALVLIACASFVAAGRAQRTGQQSDEVGPPPLKYLPREVRAQLENETKLKDRTKLSVKLADERLTLAEQHTQAERYEAATAELGIYEAIIEDALKTLHSSGPVKNKQRDQYKRLELAIRKHVPRLETMRRYMPAQNGVYAQEALEFAREARTEALNAFFDDTVLPDHPPTPSSRQADERAKGNTLAPPAKEKKPQRR